MSSRLFDDLTARRRRRRTWVLAIVVVVGAVGGGAAWLLRPRTDPPDLAARELAEAWTRGDLAVAPFHQAAPPDLQARYDELVAGLDAEPPIVSVDEVRPPTDEAPELAEADLSVTWRLAGGREWEYATTAELGLVERHWEIAWSPQLVHPRLEDGLRLGTRRVAAERGDIVAADGTPIVTERPVVYVGVQPSRAEDVATLASQLAAILDIDGDDLAQRIEDAQPDAFVPVITLREEDYLAVEDQVFPLPGTVFNRGQLPLAPSRTFARALLGSAGPVTAELIEQHPDRYVAGDVVGRSGLQRAYDERLFGTPGLEVLLRGDDAPDDPVLFADAPVPGEDVAITLDADVQQAADDVLANSEFATALVAVRPSDGHVLAVANGPDGGGFDLALEGRLPPGSTFKIVTTAALLEDGVTPDDTVPCPASTVVDGRTITNAEDQELGDIPFRQAFFRSCNTAFVRLSQQLGPDDLQEAGAWFGLGREPELGVAAFGGDVPETQGPVDLAASAIGQGRVLASPLAMAGVAATVANGAHVPPSLVLDPPPDGEPTTPEPLPAAIAETLQELTGLVVAQGTGTAARGVPGGPVHGKTGTAEYARDDGELGTHAWFVGYQGDLAFAVVVTETPGAYGGDVAAPLAADFLSRLAES